MHTAFLTVNLALTGTSGAALDQSHSGGSQSTSRSICPVRVPQIVAYGESDCEFGFDWHEWGCSHRACLMCSARWSSETLLRPQPFWCACSQSFRTTGEPCNFRPSWTTRYARVIAAVRVRGEYVYVGLVSNWFRELEGFQSPNPRLLRDPTISRPRARVLKPGGPSFLEFREQKSKNLVLYT